MPDVLVRDLSDRALELLRAQARARVRSLPAASWPAVPPGDSDELVTEDRAR